MDRKIKTSVLTPWKPCDTETISPVEVIKRSMGQENALTRMLPSHFLLKKGENVRFEN